MSPAENIRLYYKNQTDLGQAMKEFIDLYFKNQVKDIELEEKIMSIARANSEKMFVETEGSLDIAVKPKQILGKARLEVLNKILEKNGGISDK